MVPDRYWTLLWAAETRGARPLTVVMEFSQLMTCRFDLSASPSGVSGVGALELEQRSARPRRAETKDVIRMCLSLSFVVLDQCVRVP